MTVATSQTVRVTRHFDASAERVFDAWLNPEAARKWLFSTPSGQIVRAETDPRVGGKFIFVDRRDGEDIEHVGEYLEVDPPRRLVFTFAVPKFSAQNTTVSIDIVPSQSGCELTLTHERVLLEWASKTQQGWMTILDGLASALPESPGEFGVSKEPGMFHFERILPGPIERVWAYLTESDKRELWLASGEMEPRVGGSVDLTFDHSQLSRHSAPAPERFKNMSCHLSHHQVLRFEPPRLLAFTWGDGADGPSEVSFELTPQGDKVRLVLTHRRLGSRDAMVGTATGWHAHLAVLAERLEGREPEAFWSIFAKIDGKYDKRFDTK